MLTQVLIIVVLFLLSQLFAPKPKTENARPAGMGDFSFPTTSSSRAVPIAWGTVKINGGNVMWYGNLIQFPIEKKIRYSLFNTEYVTIGFQYFLGIHLGLCHKFDELVGISWGEVEVWDKDIDDPPSGPTSTITVSRFLNLFGGNNIGSGGINGEIDILYGGQDQEINPYLAQYQQTLVGTDKTSAYKGYAGIVLKDFYLGNSTFLKFPSVVVRRIPNGLGLPDDVAKLNDGNDCNPMNVAHEIITDDDWGMKWPSSMIDVSSFTAAAETLATEGNGFSFLLDTITSHDDILKEIERQIGGVIFIDHTSGLWVCKLLRADYDVDDIMELSASKNITKVDRFFRQTWADTKNLVTLSFNDREQSYKEVVAWAQDMANAQMQGNLTVTSGKNSRASVKYPGVKNADLANSLVWRDLRNLSVPRTSTTLVCTRDVYSLKLGDAFVYTNTEHGINKFAMRVSRIDYSRIDKGEILIEAIDDLTATYPSSGAAPPPTLWASPTSGLQEFAFSFAIEAPYALDIRDTNWNPIYGPVDHVWFGTVRIASASGYLETIDDIADVGFTDLYNDGNIGIFALNAPLKDNLVQGPAIGGTITVTTVSAFAKQTIIDSNAGQPTDPRDIGNKLYHMLMIEDEFLLFDTIEAGSGNDVIIKGLYRGIMDTAQPRVHPAGTQVFFVNGIGRDEITLCGGRLNGINLKAGADYDFYLRPYNKTETADPGDVTPIRVSMNDRSRRPLSPGAISINGVEGSVVSSLEGTGAGDGLGVALLFIRRDFRGGNEVDVLTIDAVFTYPDFPSVNSTKYIVSVYADPLGVDTLLFTLAESSSETTTLLRDHVLRFTNGVIPAQIGIKIEAKHTFKSVTYFQFNQTKWICDVTTALTGQFVFGALDDGVSSNIYTATVAGTYSFTLFSALSGGAIVQVSKNGGSFTTLVGAGQTTGNLAGVVIGDTVVIKHNDATVGEERFISMDAPSTGQDGFALLYKS